MFDVPYTPICGLPPFVACAVLLLLLPAVQPGWINGTLRLIEDVNNLRGNIGVIHNTAAPYEPKILQLVQAGCVAVVAFRNRPDSNVPGQSMYYITGQDQMPLNIPVVEVFQPTGAPNQILELVEQNGGLYAAIWPQDNEWKHVNETVAFHLIASIINSVLELAIILIAIWRIFCWWRSGAHLIGIAPVCILLYLISASVFFAATFLDPATTYRIYSFRTSMVLLLGGLPFFFSAGILLTYFWAETLNAAKVQATPFISEYKWPAAVTIFVLFAAEISCTAALITVPVSSFNPAYVTEVINVIVAITLTVCYVMCAVKIAKRLGEGSKTSKSTSSKKRNVRSMAWRFAASTSGYIVFVILMFLEIPYVEKPWPFKIILHLIYLAVNFSSLLQVWSFKAPKGRRRTGSLSSGSGRLNTPRSQPALVNQEP